MRQSKKRCIRRSISMLLVLMLLMQFVPMILWPADAQQDDSVFMGFANWSISGGVLAVAEGVSGNGAQITPEGGNACLQSDAVTVEPGEVLRGGIWVSMVASSTATLEVQAYSDYAGTVPSGTPVVLDSRRGELGFVELAGDYTVPQGVRAVSLRLVTGDSGVYVADDAYLKVYTDLPEFVGVMGDGYGVTGQLSLFYPLAYPAGDWAEQREPARDPNGFNYARIVEDGKLDRGAVQFVRGDVYEHIGITLGANLVVGEEYTIKLWVKGNAAQTYGGLQVYGNGDPVLATFGTNGSCNDPTRWYEISKKVTATRNHLYVFMNGGGYACDVTIDNVQVLDSAGNDVLKGLGNFLGDGSLSLGSQNRILNPEFEDTLYSYLPLEEFNGTFAGAGQVTENLTWTLNEGSFDTLEAVVDENGNHICVTKLSSESMLLSPVVEVVPGGTYQLVLEAKTTGEMVLGGFFCDTQGQEVSAWSPAVSYIGGQWSEISQYFTVPQNACGFKIALPFTGNAGDTLEIDNVAIYSCRVMEEEPEETEPEEQYVPVTFDSTKKADAYVCSYTEEWVPMYPTGNPDSGTWGAWSRTSHYAEVVKEGHNDVGSLHLKSNVGKNVGVTINAGMTPGQKYTLTLWAKGTSNSGRVLGMYCNGDQVIIAESAKLSADWSQYSVSFTATVSQLNMLASDWGVTDLYLDNITLTDAAGKDLLAGKGDFYKEKSQEEEPVEPTLPPQSSVPMKPITLDTSKKSDAYTCSYTDEWVPMYPSGTPGSTWPAWDSTHYGEVVQEGYADAGSLYLKTAPSKNTGVAINAGMTPGQRYTLGLWVKGTSNAGRVLAMYGNGDAIIIGASSQLSATWKHYEVTFAATMSQLNILAADWGNTDVYLDNITLTDTAGNDLLAGKGDFCVEDPDGEVEIPEETEPEEPKSVILDTENYASHGMAPGTYWSTFYPTGTPGGTWAAWSSDSHYGEVVESGYKDEGALHLKSNSGKNVGVAIHAGMTPGQQYTLGLWVKGTSNAGRVLAMYGNGDSIIINTWEDLSPVWTYYEVTFTASLPQLNLVAADWGVSDLYIDNVTLKDTQGKDLLLSRGDFCIHEAGKPIVDRSVNLLKDGDFEGIAYLQIPGWMTEGTVTMKNTALNLKVGGVLQSLRYSVEPGQIMEAGYTGEGGMLLLQFGKEEQTVSTMEVPADGLLFSVPENAQWIRVGYVAVSSDATISQVKLVNKGDPANLDFELKSTDHDLPMNWSTWTAVNDPNMPTSAADGAYTVSHQAGTGVENSNALYVVLNQDVPENADANALTAVIDSIKVKVEPNTTYSFSFWAKMDNENGCIYPSVKCYQADGSADGGTAWLNGAYVTDSTGEWKQYKTSFSTGSNSAYITFRLEMKASNQGAEFWADRITYQAMGSALDTNLDFELGVAGDLPLNWTTYERNYKTEAQGAFGNYAATYEPTGSQDKSGALKVQKLTDATTEIYVCSGLIDVEPNTAYYFSYDAATTKASGSDQILMMLRMRKENGENVADESKAFYWPSSAYATGYFNWSENGAIFETPEDCDNIQIMFCFKGSKGYTAFVDNVSLIKTEKIEDMNLDFEYSVGQIPLNWEFSGVLSQSTMSIYQENTFSGKQALRVQRTNGELDCSFVFSQKMIPVTAGDKIEVVANIASQNATSGHFSMCFLGYGDTVADQNKMVNAMYGQERVTNSADGWSQWDTYEMVWTVPKGVNYIQLCLRVGGTNNDMLIDDITVYNYTKSDYIIYQEDFKNPSTTGLPGGWVVDNVTGTAEAKVNGQMSLTGNETSNVEISTKIYSLKSDYIYNLTANVFTTGTAKGQLIMEAVNWDGSVAGQPVALELNTGAVNMELQADFESLSAVYYRLILRKTEGNGSVCIQNVTLRQTSEPYKGITWAGKWLTHPDETARIAASPHPFTERHYYTRTVIYLDKPVVSAQMQITADDKFTMYINGMQVYSESRSGDTWDLPVTVDIAQYLQQGKNVIAIDMFNNIYLYGLLFDGIVRMEEDSTLRFYSTSDTMIAAECLSNEITPTRNPLWTEEDEMSWMNEDYDISTCPLWVNADEFASNGGGGWGDIDFDPTEYSDYKILSNEFTFPKEEVTAGATVKVTAQLMLENEIPTTSAFKVDIWKRNTTTRVCSGVLTVAGGKNTDSWPIGEEFTAEFELQVPQFLAEGQYTIQLENTVSIVSDWFINNKVGNISVVQIDRPLTTTASVEVVNGKATMIVNGEAKAPLWYARPERPAQFEEHIVTEFGEIGVDTVVSYIFLNNVYGDVWTPEGFVPDLVDSMMLDTLAGNPEAQLIIALDFNAPQWWCEENPDEMAKLSETTVSKTNASFASEKWKQDSMAIMLEAIDHMMAQPYANNIIGFKITAGYTLEWNWWATSGIYTDVGDFSECGIQAFRAWLTNKYGTDAALQEAWGDSSVTLETVMPPAKELRADEYWKTVATIQDMPEFMDYELYMAELKADTIEWFCKTVDEHLQDRLIIGTYAGYFFPGGGYEFSSAVANVYFQELLQSEHVDFIKSPWTYGMREIGETAQFMGPVDSLDPYGKLWIIEEDSRLNLKEMAEGQDGRAGVGWTRYYQQSVEQLKRNYAYYLSKGMGVSFYNLMWDFTDDDQYYGIIKQMYEEMTLSLGLHNETVAEIALIVDGESQMLIPWEGEYVNHTLYDSIYFEQLKELGYSGASYDIYLLDDLADGLIPEYKVYIFLATTNMTEKEREAVRGLQKNGNILVWQFTDAIANGERTDLSLMEDMIGMDLKVVSTKRKQIASSIVFDNTHWLTKGMNEGQPYGVESYDTMSPVIAITDSSVTALAYHSTTSTSDGTPEGQVSLGVKDMGDWISIYSAVPNMPTVMLRNIQQKAGVHVYNENSTDVIYASNNYVSLHSVFAGERTITLPGNYTVYDVFNRQIISTNTNSFTVTLSGRETRLFRLSAPETVQVYIGQNAGGTVTNKGLTNLKPGDSMQFSFQPNQGYRLSYLLVDGSKVFPQSDTYSFENIRESHTVIAHFSQDYSSEETPAAPPTPIPAPAEEPGNPAWVLPVILGGSAMLVLIAAFVVIFLAKRKKRAGEK